MNKFIDEIPTQRRHMTKFADELTDALAHLNAALDNAQVGRAWAHTEEAKRAVSVLVTKLEEARMWLRKAQEEDV